jgi:hypothetical protein
MPLGAFERALGAPKVADLPSIGRNGQAEVPISRLGDCSPCLLAHLKSILD